MAAYVSGALREHTCLLVVLEDAAEFLRQQSIRQRMSASKMLRNSYVSRAYVSTRQHTSAYVSGALREHTCLLVVLEDAAEFLRQQSIRQHTSAYVSGALREHPCLLVVLEDAAEFLRQQSIR
jgi:predicted metallopeptidase